MFEVDGVVGADDSGSFQSVVKVGWTHVPEVWGIVPTVVDLAVVGRSTRQGGAVGGVYLQVGVDSSEGLKVIHGGVGDQVKDVGCRVVEFSIAWMRLELVVLVKCFASHAHGRGAQL